MDVEKVVRQVAWAWELGNLRQYKVRFERSFIFVPPALISSFDPSFVSGAFTSIYLQSDGRILYIMEYRRRRHIRIPRATIHSKHYPSELSPLITDKIGKLPLCIFSIFLLEHVTTILLPLRGTSNRPCHVVRGPLSHARTLEGRRALTDKDGPWDTARREPEELGKNIVVPCSHTLPRLYHAL